MRAPDRGTHRYTSSRRPVDILFTGIITKKVINSIRKDPLVGSLISLEDAAHELVSLYWNGAPVRDDQLLTLGIMGYHLNRCTSYLNITPEELRASGKSKVVTTSVQEVLEEYLKNHQNIGRKVEGRLVWV